LRNKPGSVGRPENKLGYPAQATEGEQPVGLHRHLVWGRHHIVIMIISITIIIIIMIEMIDWSHMQSHREYRRVKSSAPSREVTSRTTIPVSSRLGWGQYVLFLLLLQYVLHNEQYLITTVSCCMG
jgi:hypothetical protein